MGRFVGHGRRPIAVDRKLEAAVLACDRKVSAHLDRLAFFRQQIVAARLLQGALAAGRAAKARVPHDQQRLDQDALDHFRAVLTVPGHDDDLAALELIAHQIARIEGGSQAAINSYAALIDRLTVLQQSCSRNLILARAKRNLAALRYPPSPAIAQGLLTDSIALITQFGPPRDRDLLELAESYHLDGIARLRLRGNVRGPQQLSTAQAHYRDLLRSLARKRRGLFRWMASERKFAGHRVAELQSRAEQGITQVEHLLVLNDRHQALLIASLARGSGIPRQNRRPLR